MSLTLHIDLGAVAENYRALAARHRAPVAGVIKADGYGLGAVEVAPVLRAAGAEQFFVATPSEGVAVRGAIPGADLFILGGLWPAKLADYRAHNLIPVLNSFIDLTNWMREASRSGLRLPAAIHIDTGMRRLGLDQRTLDTLAADPEPFRLLDVRYVMTHLASADEPDSPQNEEQAESFERACARLPPTPRSFANSSGIFLGTRFRSDLARPGAALYGVNPIPGRLNPMRNTVRLLGRVLQLREVAAGEGVGYNASWRAARPARVATVACGYADGYLRSLSNRGFAAFDGRRLPLIGRVSMDLLTFDASEASRLREGDALELIGPAVPPDELARLAGTNAYEILTSLSRRADRSYFAP